MSGIIAFHWNGEAMVPLKRLLALANKRYVVGQVYRLSEEEERSTASHNHYMASVSEAWKNLPERFAERFPSPTHLRRYALINTGFYKERQMVCESEAAARKFAAFLEPCDEYAIIDVRGNVVVEYKAKSQAIRGPDAMSNAEFKDSKEKTLAYLANMVGIEVQKLKDEAGRAA